ncbi:TRAP transporter small permease [Roseibium sp. MMSF_3544]|uniref:TRAP transporter small permease n=1 Tax=unclassified Roseibium TaxID=2629323 RepID=UPI00273EFE11|nr:TRAP transporter small permease [Roseibium sp. MMSF_3544]
MAEQTSKKSVQGLPERVLALAALASGLILCGVMVLVMVSVFFRYVLSAPLLGSQEIVQLGMVFVVMLAMPYTALTNQHIRVDIFDPRLGELGRYICDIFARLLGICVLYMLVEKAWDKMLDAVEYEDVTNMIELPLWTAYAAICAGMGLYILVLLLQLWRQFRTGVRGYE